MTDRTSRHSLIFRAAATVADLYLSERIRAAEEYGWLERLSISSDWEAEARRDFYRIQAFGREAEEAETPGELEELYEETLKELESGFQSENDAAIKLASDLGPYIGVSLATMIYPPAAAVALPLAWEYTLGNAKRREERMYEDGEDEIASIMRSGNSKELLDSVYTEYREQLQPDERENNGQGFFDSL